MSDKDIIKIELIKGARIKNTHDNFMFPRQYIIKVSFRNGERRIIDLISGRDTTSIDYYEVIEDDHCKTKVLFKENIEDL